MRTCNGAYQFTNLTEKKSQVLQEDGWSEMIRKKNQKNELESIIKAKFFIEGIGMEIGIVDGPAYIDN